MLRSIKNNEFGSFFLIEHDLVVSCYEILTLCVIYLTIPAVTVDQTLFF